LGGGNIVMGDTLNPSERLAEQTEEEHNLMREWFNKEANLEDYFI
jgi:hypothetical protein